VFTVSIIVPARDEQASLGACLRSLVTQCHSNEPTPGSSGAPISRRDGAGISAEIIVVDDASTDSTRAIAESFPSVRLISAPPLSAGWCGKSNAAWAGAREAGGEWLLFTDADTVHRAGSLARAIAEARERGVSLLSYSPRQEVHGLWQRALMPLVFAELACTYRATDVCDPSSPVAAANGQYLLLKREAYDAIGGHAAVAHDLLEDVALARLVKQSGRRIRFRYGADAVRTRMYRNLAQMCEGWTKNLAVLFVSPRRLALKRLAEFMALVGSLAVCALAFTADANAVGAGAGLLALLTWALLFRRLRRAHFDPLSTALAPLGLPLFSWLLLRSVASHRRGSVRWKGRQYHFDAATETASSAGSGVR
jgi:glycosyltransferase involved in cell wall biosynthesis